VHTIFTAPVTNHVAAVCNLMAIGNRLKRALRALVRGALAVVFGAVLVITVGAIALVVNAMLEYGTLERKLFHELEAIRLGADARKTELTGRLDYICFNTDNRAVQTEFREESIRLQNSFSQSIDSCGIEGSCCKLVSDQLSILFGSTRRRHTLPRL